MMTAEEAPLPFTAEWNIEEGVVTQQLVDRHRPQCKASLRLSFCIPKER